MPYIEDVQRKSVVHKVSENLYVSEKSPSSALQAGGETGLKPTV